MDEAALAEMTRGLEADGFLAPAFDAHQNQIVSANRSGFEMCDRFNRSAIRAWLGHPITQDGLGVRDAEPVTVQLFARAMNGFQGAVLLLRRGMTVEAGTLIRTVYEAAFWLNYIQARPEEGLADLTIDEQFSQRGRLAAALRWPKSHERVTELTAASAELKAQLKGKSPPKLEDVADLGGMDEFFAFYKALCGSSAHASFQSISHYLEVNDGLEAGHAIGPDLDGTPAKLAFACHALLAAMIGYQKLLGSEEFSAEIHEFVLDLHGLSFQG